MWLESDKDYHISLIINIRNTPWQKATSVIILRLELLQKAK